MDHFIDHIEIRNFKSIRELNVSGFKRINLFIGRPNVGKSNILEALSLFSFSWSKLTDIIRVENLRELHYNGEVNEKVVVSIKREVSKDFVETCELVFLRSMGITTVGLSRKSTSQPDNIHINDKSAYQINDKFDVFKPSGFNAIFIDEIKKYTFKSDVKLFEKHVSFLLPPFGNNILYVLELMPKLRKQFAQWFRQYGLRLVLDTASQSLKIQKEKGDDEVFQLPYSSVADTLQRIIFYKTAVASNENSVLLFEEPEAHAYPPYIVEFTQEVIKSETNQFFIVTHSPLIVNDFLEGAIDDLAIFMVDFKDGQTVAKPLTRDEIQDVHKYGVDLFFNNEAYLS
ncbi:AAA family ATPase [Spirosoma radiotolerans]|uniref:AAA family ATPase n=1 Tax=Spirosoma radiotolerans TaxID=1379870 RepID=UPI0009E5C46F|nr:AAA family ATPase [Spirosoma radiotolerans]